MDFDNLHENLLAVLPAWHYYLEKPFKQVLDTGISLEMYYAIATLDWKDTQLTMSELCEYTKMTKQQMTKVVNKLVEHGFVERIYDSSDRRIIRLRLTETAHGYLHDFIENDVTCFYPLWKQMDRENLEKFSEGLEMIRDALFSVPFCPETEAETNNSK